MFVALGLATRCVAAATVMCSRAASCEAALRSACASVDACVYMVSTSPWLLVVILYLGLFISHPHLFQ